MEKIKAFLEISSGSGSGDGSGYGSGDGSGYGSGYGDGYGSGSGSGSGYGDGSGSGSGSGSGYGDGSGSGYGDGDGIKSFCGDTVYMIDTIPTILKRVVGNLAKGFILKTDLTLEACYVAKSGSLFAHGKTSAEAGQALREKIFANMDTDETIDMFLEEFKPGIKYPAKDFYVWHNRLTGSCEMGRNHFVSTHNIDLENGLYTVEEFITITENDFGGNIIKKLKEKMAEA